MDTIAPTARDELNAAVAKALKDYSGLSEEDLAFVIVEKIAPEVIWGSGHTAAVYTPNPYEDPR